MTNRIITPNPGRLTARWDARERDVMYWSPNGPDGHLLHGAILGRHKSVMGDGTWDISFLHELVNRGYDLRTLKFRVTKIAPGDVSPLPYWVRSDNKDW